MATKKGRPNDNNIDIIVNDVNVEYLSKTDTSDNSRVYLKFIDPISKLKLVIDTQ